MKKWFLGLTLAVGLCSFIGNRVEAEYYDTCCYDLCDDYSAGPLCPSSFSIQLKGGVVPTHYTEKGKIWLIDPALEIPVVALGGIPKFSKQFDTPWTIGLELGYALNDHAQLFVEGSWQHAKGKRHRSTVGSLFFDEKYSNYENWGAYLGARYFFNNWLCDNLSPFIGFKAGFVHHKKIHVSLSEDDAFILKSAYFHSRTGPSVGAQIGLNYNFCFNWNAVLTFEVVASHALKNNRNVVFPAGAPGSVTNANIGETGYLVSYPITLGVRYDF